MPDPRLIEQIDEPGLVEKEWHVVRAIGVLATIDHGNTRAAFSGGTSLSVAWGLIEPGADTNGGGGLAPADPADRFARMFDLLTGDAPWADEYDKFVHDKSFAKPDEVISSAAALEATRRLTDHLR